MKKNMTEQLMRRRSRYALSPVSSLRDEEIIELVNTVVQHVPSAFNSQSTRVVVLLAEHHKKLWEIVQAELEKVTPPAAFEKTRKKLSCSFASGYGTVLFFEDTTVVKDLQERFPLYADNFPVWSQHTSAMHQLALWTSFAENGLGASLQHYNPLIDDAVSREWNIDPAWQLVAQMPFGVATDELPEKTFLPLAGRVKVYR